jgi:hypothetical protein
MIAAQSSRLGETSNLSPFTIAFNVLSNAPVHSYLYASVANLLVVKASQSKSRVFDTPGGGSEPAMLAAAQAAQTKIKPEFRPDSNLIQTEIKAFKSVLTLFNPKMKSRFKAWLPGAAVTSRPTSSNQKNKSSPYLP